MFLKFISDHFLQRVNDDDADRCGQEGTPVAVSIAASLKKPLTEGTVVFS